jgi:hypothetical protein
MHDPKDAWELWRGIRGELFVSHPESPIPEEDRKGYRGPFHYEYDPAARTVAGIHPLPSEAVEVRGSDGSAYQMTRFGEALFDLYGEQRRLDVYWIDVYGGGIFLSFRDETSGTETYGAGRYLLDTIKGADLGSASDLLILDFNFAYQPSCSYDPRWVCPLAPPQNRLPVAVRAGERLGPG